MATNTYTHINGIRSRREVGRSRYEKRRRHERNRKNGRTRAICLLLALFISVGVFRTVIAVKGNQGRNTRYKYYTSITIQEGDSLWSIAQKYCETTKELPDYVEELKEINGLSEETIHSGNHLVVYYYSSDYK